MKIHIKTIKHMHPMAIDNMIISDFQVNEEPTTMTESDSLIPRDFKTSQCSNCRRNIAIDLIYVCSSGHDICSACNIRLTRCLLCSKAISDSPLFFCKFNKFGCQMKALLDEVRRHETDCDFKEFLCPFQEIDGRCNWYQCERNLIQHLKEFHKDDVVIKSDLDGEFPRKDKAWIFIAYDKVFKCYVWIYEYHVDWIIKYVGPQKYASNYTYQVKLQRPENVTLYRESSRCSGYNNFALQDCVSIPVKDVKDYLTKGRVYFRVKIMKNIPCVADVR